MKHGPTIEVHQLRSTRHGEPSETHAAIRQMIDSEASQFRIRVRETQKQERASSTGLRPSFVKEAARLRETISDIHLPETYQLDRFRKQPFYPVMLKNETLHRSRHKYLIETPEQFATFEKWLAVHGEEADWICQQFIDCPSDSYSSFRVIVDCTGEIQTSQILYSAPKEMNLMHDKGDQQDTDAEPMFHLEDPDGEYFLNAPVTASNRLYAEERTQLRRSEKETTRTVREYDERESRYVDRVVPGFGGTRTVREYDERESRYVDRVVPERDERAYLNQKYNDFSRWKDLFNDDGMIGGRLTLDRNPASHAHSERELEIIRQYGLATNDQTEPRLPKEAARVSSAIGRELGMDGSTVKELVMGVDLVQDSATGKMYVIEVNRRPRIMSVQDYFGGVPVIEALAAHRWSINSAVGNIAKEFGMERKD